MQYHPKDIGLFLKENDIKPSYQRIKIYEYLMDTKEHPSIDQIYRDLIPEMPTLSKTTVYNTLNLFVERGVAQLIAIEDHETRYDADMHLHGHFKCEVCQQVIDFPVSETVHREFELGGHRVKETHLYVKGICKNCTSKEK
jgi:Fe2+ or Zn2+ uptake regulation protein